MVFDDFIINKGGKFYVFDEGFLVCFFSSVF